MRDPAVLFYISDWLTSTKEMKADERGWFLNLILHQYDKGSLPDDVEELANLADVRFSEYALFEAKWKQVLKHKFKQMPDGRLANERMNEILRKRESFVEKRSSAGSIGYVVKFAKNELNLNTSQIDFLKENVDFATLDIKNKQMLEQVLKQVLKLYRNGNRVINKDTNINEEIVNDFENVWNLYDKKTGEKDKLKKKWDKLSEQDRSLIMAYIPNYIKSQPDKKFRKNFETFLNNKSWNDELVGLTSSTGPATTPVIEIRPNDFYDEVAYLRACEKFGIENPKNYYED